MKYDLNDAQKKHVKKYIYKINKMNKIELDMFDRELQTLKSSLAPDVYRAILDAINIHVLELNKGEKINPLVDFGEIKLSEL